MPYLVFPNEYAKASNFGFQWVPDDYQPAPGEVVVDERPDPAEQVFEGGALRCRTIEEKLEEAKAARIDEFAQNAITDLAPLFTGSHGRDETLQGLADAVVRLCEQTGLSYDPRLDQVRAVAAKAYQKKAAIESARSFEELEEISWTA